MFKERARRASSPFRSLRLFGLHCNSLSRSMSRSLRIHFFATMSSRSTYRGGRNQWRRSFSERPYNNGGGRGHFVSGDSHIRSVRDSNLDYRQGNFSNQTPPPPHLQFRQPPPHPQFWQPPPHPQFQQPPPHPQFRQPPPYNRNPQFRPQPPPFVQNQVFRPRPPKPLDYRNWEHAKAAPPPDSDRFLVLSYNILADYLALATGANFTFTYLAIFWTGNGGRKAYYLSLDYGRQT